MERNYPMIHLYGNGSSDGDEQAAKVRIAFSRERDDRSRSDKADGEWTCKIVSPLPLVSVRNKATRHHKIQIPKCGGQAIG